jgi:hypothetical protein
MSHANGCSGLGELVVVVAVTSAIETDVSRCAKAAQAHAENRGSDIWTNDLAEGAGVCRIRDLAAPLSELRSGTGERSLTLLAPFLGTLLEFRGDR